MLYYLILGVIFPSALELVHGVFPMPQPEVQVEWHLSLPRQRAFQLNLRQVPSPTRSPARTQFITHFVGSIITWVMSRAVSLQCCQRNSVHWQLTNLICGPQIIKLVVRIAIMLLALLQPLSLCCELIIRPALINSLHANPNGNCGAA